MGKLHELLAVEGDLKAQAQRDTAAVKDIFEKGAGKFLGQVSVHKPASENDETFPPKISRVATTVDQELATVTASFGRWIDAAVQKEETNQEATAVLVFNSQEFLLPATALLNLESKLLEIRMVYQAIPTNDVTASWKFDKDIGQFISDPPEVRRSTKKIMRAFVASEATKEHPAQVETYNEDVLSGHTTITKQSGMITPNDKRERLERLNHLLQKVKQARQRANDIEATKFEIGKCIFDFINGE